MLMKFPGNVKYKPNCVKSDPKRKIKKKDQEKNPEDSEERSRKKDPERDQDFKWNYD